MEVKDFNYWGITLEHEGHTIELGVELNYISVDGRTLALTIPLHTFGSRERWGRIIEALSIVARMGRKRQEKWLSKIRDGTFSLAELREELRKSLKQQRGGYFTKSYKWYNGLGRGPHVWRHSGYIAILKKGYYDADLMIITKDGRVFVDEGTNPPLIYSVAKGRWKPNRGTRLLREIPNEDVIDYVNRKFGADSDYIVKHIIPNDLLAKIVSSGIDP